MPRHLKRTVDRAPNRQTDRHTTVFGAAILRTLKQVGFFYKKSLQEVTHLLSFYRQTLINSLLFFVCLFYIQKQ